MVGEDKRRREEEEKRRREKEEKIQVWNISFVWKLFGLLVWKYHKSLLV